MSAADLSQILAYGIPVSIIILVVLLLVLSRLFPSQWQMARKILGGRSRGGKLIVLGIFLFGMNETFKIVREVLGLSQDSSSTVLMWASYFMILWGVGAYLSGN